MNQASARQAGTGTAALPTTLSRRRRVLALVESAVARLARPVRLCDVIEEGERATVGIAPKLIGRDFSNLRQTGEIVVVHRVRGGATAGTCYCLPASLPAGEHDRLLARLPAAPVPWLEMVWSAFDALWTESCRAAAAAGTQPIPITTGAVRERLRQTTSLPQMDDAQLLVNAMTALERGVNARIRRVARTHGSRARAWVPLGISEHEVAVSGAHASDAERVEMAVRRACDRLQVPAVGLQDIERAIAADPSLRIRGQQPLYLVLADTIKHHVGGRHAPLGRGGLDSHPGLPKPLRRRPPVVRVGRVRGHPYYAAIPAKANDVERATRVADADAYLALLRLDERWRRLRAKQELDALAHSAAPSLKQERARRLWRACVSIGDALDAAESRPEAWSEHGRALLRRAIDQALDAIRRSGLEPAESDIASELQDDAREQRASMPLWSPDQLRHALAPIYPNAARAKQGSEIVRLLWSTLPRVANPGFVARRRGEAEMWFDRTAALIWGGLRFGGPECSMQAGIAKAELGPLRDARLVLPCFEHPLPNVRLVAVACAAFLRDRALMELLRAVARTDREPGLRRSALWAYAFADGPDVHSVLRAAAEADAAAFVRDFARRAVGMSEQSLWYC